MLKIPDATLATI